METKKYQLPKEFATKWVDALRSTPENKHHAGELRSVKRPDCYCGIGLGLVANNYEISEDGMNLIIDGEKIDYFEKFIFQEPFVQEFVSLNDQKEYTFNELADFIEGNVEFV